jgi:hypothetical protein
MDDEAIGTAVAFAVVIAMLALGLFLRSRHRDGWKRYAGNVLSLMSALALLRGVMLVLTGDRD